MLFGYSVRTVKTQRATVLPALLAVIVAVAGITGVMVVFEGMARVLGGGTPTGNAVLVSKRASYYIDSRFPMDARGKLAVLPGIASVGGEPQVAYELLESGRTWKADGILTEFTMRGVDPLSFTLRPDVQLTSGERPENGKVGVIIGEGLAKLLRDGKIGDKLRVGKYMMPIVGTFRARGTSLDSEVWLPRTLLADAYGVNRISYALVKTTGPGAIDELSRAIGQARELNAEAVEEREFDRRAMGRLDPVVKSIFALILILSVGATLACASTMYGMFLSRQRELATLMAIGFTKRQVAVMLLRESLAIALVGGGLGMALAMTFSGRDLTMIALNLTIVYQTVLTTRALLVGAASMAAIGLLGGGVAVAQILRLDILRSLRSA